MAGYRYTPTDPFDRLNERLRVVESRLEEIERPGGTQIYDAVATLKAIIGDLPGQITAAIGLGLTTGFVTASGTVTAGAITSPGVMATDVTAIPGPRAAVWGHIASGVFGQTVSSITRKTDLGPVPFTAAQVMACAPFVFHYIAQIDIRDNPLNPYYDPDYEVPWDVGFMAQHLITNGLEMFVTFEADGVTPLGIDYALFGAVASHVVLEDHDRRLAALEAAGAEL